MKKLLLFILFFSSLNAFACDCDFNIINLYQKADFVAKIKVLKNHVNEPSDASNYKVDIQTLSLFKGNTTSSVYINGYNGVPAKLITSCDFSLPVNTEILIFGSNNDDKIYVNYCTSITHDMPESIVKLNFLKVKANNYTSNAPFSSTYLTYIPSKIFKDYPTSFYGKSYIIKLTIDKDKTVSDIEFVSDLDTETKENLANDIKNKIDWKKKLADINTNYSYSFLTEFFAYNLP
jgi:hypothetical protein